jgi:single-stranded DNA-specific DHH superfamily exonuclease
MEKDHKTLEFEIEQTASKFLEAISDRDILIISHFDTDGITSATILVQTLKKLDRRFSLKILKRLEEKDIFNLPNDKVIIFLDLASGSLNHLSKINQKTFL